VFGVRQTTTAGGNKRLILARRHAKSVQHRGEKMTASRGASAAVQTQQQKTKTATAITATTIDSNAPALRSIMISTLSCSVVAVRANISSTFEVECSKE